MKTANGSGSNNNKERRISDKRLTKVRQDITSGTKQLATWEKKVEIVDNEIKSLNSDASNRPLIIKLETTKTYYESKVDGILKRVNSSQRTLSEYIDKNNRLDDKRFGIE
ncbi:MAG: hypothetical protein DAHOPDDO_00057 [Ignavibacteriaceae bacterium]|nr:hypothetical protein [Ignavibacteriaceae bacterium]